MIKLTGYGQSISMPSQLKNLRFFYLISFFRIFSTLINQKKYIYGIWYGKNVPYLILWFAKMEKISRGKNNPKKMGSEKFTGKIRDAPIKYISHPLSIYHDFN